MGLELRSADACRLVFAFAAELVGLDLRAQAGNVDLTCEFPETSSQAPHPFSLSWTASGGQEDELVILDSLTCRTSIC